MKNSISLITIQLLLLITPLFASATQSAVWKDVNIQKNINEVPMIRANNARSVEIDVEAIRLQLVDAPHRNRREFGSQVSINLPLPDGSTATFEVYGNTTMHPGLQAKYPSIRTYDAISGKGDLVKLDVTPKGFHAMILRPNGETVFIDPYLNGNTKDYLVYNKSDFITDKVATCEFTGESMLDMDSPTNKRKAFGTCELRTYRLAISATGEYTAFHGGTVTLALAAQVTTMNRVNGVYEKDMAITLELIANNDLLIFDDAANDPFTNGDAGSMINENQNEVTNIIGSANFDIGHVFGTNSGGLAGLGVVCSNNQKASGVTGSTSPIGDTFDIDYVAHEMGHQFGANHTQNNSCNNNNGTSVEPGSGSTIMGYAGICAPNVQNNSDDYFHGISLEEIENEILSHSCPVVTGLSNDAPVISGTNGNIAVPASTPFSLTANATDADGDIMTFCWEQMNATQSTQPPVASSISGPSFRSINPSIDPTRYFPNLNDLAAGTNPTWEVLSSVGRTMDFRVTVRDNAVGGSCTDHQDVTLTIAANAGPFVVLYPSASGISWGGLTTQTVTWDVANSDASPVNCSQVDILLSTDGGLTYPTVLATNVANDGSQSITAPNISTTTARVMVVSASGTFFDISDENFEIISVSNDFIMNIPTASASICPPSDAVYTIDIDTVGVFVDPVVLNATNVPAGAIATFGATTVSPGNSTTLTLSNTGSVTPGTYTITVEGTSSSGIKYFDVTVQVSSPAPGTVTLNAPLDGTIGVTLPATLNWFSTGTGDVYDLIIATDAQLTNVVDNPTNIDTSHVSSLLSGATTYYWAVTSHNECGTGTQSAVFTFETVNEITLPTDGTAPTATSCSGTLFDSGGAGSDYGNNEDAEITIAPVGAATVDLDFVSFSVEAGSNNNCDYDYLEIYDGPNTSAALIDRYCNGNVPTTISSTSGSITLVFHSDQGSEDSGFQVNWQCVMSTIAPTPDFTVDTDTTCVGTVNFTDASTDGPVSWAWDFGDGNTSTDQSPTHTYTTNGLYTVSLTATNDNGSNTEIKVDYIFVTLPTAPTGTGATICANDQATLTANGPAGFNWYDAATGGNLVHSGATFVTPSIATNTTYYVATAVATASMFGAKTDNSGGGNNFNFDQHLVFDVYEEMELISVLVYAEGAGDRTIELRDNGGNVLQTATVNVPDGEQRVLLNFVIAPGTDYQLAMDVNGTVDLYRNNGGTNFPYDLGGLGTLKESSAGVDYYYFFYDWEFKKADCISERIPVDVTVNSLPDANVSSTGETASAATGLSYQWVDCNDAFGSIANETNQDFTPAIGGNYAVVVSDGTCADTSACINMTPSGVADFTQHKMRIFPNPSEGLYHCTADVAAGIDQVDIHDVSGRLLKSVRISELQFSVDLSTYPNGVYFMQAKGNGKTTFFKLIKQ